MERLKKVGFFVEANNFERLMLWSESKEDNDWIDDNSGFALTIGNINEDEDKPVCVSFGFATINGMMVCFYEAISRYVDYTMIENWIKENYPVKYDNDTRWAMTDTMNFHNVLHTSREKTVTNG